jgi:hypothetical protein
MKGIGQLALTSRHTRPAKLVLHRTINTIERTPAAHCASSEASLQKVSLHPCPVLDVLLRGRFFIDAAAYSCNTKHTSYKPAAGFRTARLLLLSWPLPAAAGC